MTHPDDEIVDGHQRARARDLAMWLPLRLVDELVAQKRREREAAAEKADDEQHAKYVAIQEEHRKRKDAEAESASPVTTLMERQLAFAAAPGYHRVLTDYRRAVTGDDLGRSADSDIRARVERVRKRLLELGPDRRVGVPPDWRMSCEMLEAALPHMRTPIDALRKAYALAGASRDAPRVPPILLLGAPGVGKTHFAQRVGAMLGVTKVMVQMAQPTAGCDLLGSDAHWSTSKTGVLFDHLCLGEHANPVLLLDEVDKATPASYRVDATAQLHAVLERETSRRLRDVSVDIEFDASLVTYLATANDHRSIPVSILSRFDVHVIAPPSAADAFSIASAIARQALSEHDLVGRVRFDRRALALLAHMSPRRMQRVAERVLGAALLDGRELITEDAVWRELDAGAAPALH